MEYPARESMEFDVVIVAAGHRACGGDPAQAAVADISSWWWASTPCWGTSRSTGSPKRRNRASRRAPADDAASPPRDAAPRTACPAQSAEQCRHQPLRPGLPPAALDAPPAPDAAIMAARKPRRVQRASRCCAPCWRASRAAGCASREATGVRRRQSAGEGDVRGRSARPATRTSRACRSSPLRAAARPHDGGDRARPHQRLHRQRDPLAPARQPHADAAGKPDLPALHEAPDRARRSRHPGVPRGPSAAALLASPTGSASRGRPLARLSQPAPAKSAHCELFIRPTCCARAEKRFAWRDFLAIRKALAE